MRRNRSSRRTNQQRSFQNDDYSRFAGPDYHESDSKDFERPYDMDDEFENGEFSFDKEDFGRDINRSRFADTYSLSGKRRRDQRGRYAENEYGMRNGYGPNDQFRSNYSRRWSQDNRSEAFLERKNFKGIGPKGYKRSDERIKEDVCETLTRSWEVDASDIEVEVKEGCVYLKGSISSREEKRGAEAAIENISGITDVQNELRISQNLDGWIPGVGGTKVSDKDEGGLLKGLS